MRAFIGIQPDALALRDLTACLRPLIDSGGDDGLRWIASDNLHVTLCFLGELTVPRLSILYPVLDRVLGKAAGFRLDFLAPVYLPSDNCPRVLAFDIAPVPELIRLQADLAEAMTDLGFKSERRQYRPHLSMARVRRGAKPPPLDLCCGRIDAAIGEVILFQSVLRPRSADYRVLRRFRLGAG